MKSKILPFVLQNRLKFGSVNPKAVLGLVLRNNPELKKDVPSVLKEIEIVVFETKDLSKEEMTKQLQDLNPDLLHEKKKEVKGPLKPLKNAEKGKVVVRIAPSPSGALHIGHAYGAALNAMYANMYNGKFIVRIEDTNPENIYDKAYDLIPQDGKWISNDNVSQVVVQSDRLGMYYDYAEKLVGQGNAYVCTCNPDTFREMKAKGEACPCRELGKEEQHLRYAKMFNGYVEGEAVLRLKTDIKHKNPAMRDFALMRINEHIHPKTGKEQRVWPLMILAVAIDDHDLGVTHVLNGKDHTDNAKKETMIMDCFSWTHPEYQHWGRINFEGMKISSSETRLKIEQQEYTGWDDIRLPFLPALKRRGYYAAAIRKWAAEIGLSLTDKTVSKDEFWKHINAFNKEIIDPIANRYFVVIDPVQIEVNGAPEKKVEMNLHDDFEDRGTRSLQGMKDLYISNDDKEKLEEGKLHRLIDYCNFTVENGQFRFVSANYEEYKNADNKGKIIHWLPVGELVDVEVVLEDHSVMKGYGEPALNDVEEGTIVQLERMYFAKLDTKNETLVFWYLHT
ncbi:TPA: glutamate--tRNA ligase [Candidatus Woesearchaeota archaeon]|nr:glutamate--tRNA ligase [archaeon]HIJ11525.1 glutamate--tRNA ligase [Candidatus Woesearchaeota archaeon]